MSNTVFNPPPGWPVPPGWEPPAGWEPDPSWPPAPAGWSFWVTADSHLASAPSDSAQPQDPGAAQHPPTETLSGPEGSPLSPAHSPPINVRFLVGGGAIVAVVLIIALVLNASDNQRASTNATMPTGTTTTTPAAPPIGESLTQRGTWKFFNKDGYTYDLTLSLSAPMKFEDVRGKSHPNNTQLVVGKQCGDGPTLNGAAVILGRISATATTPQFDTMISTNIGFAVEEPSAFKYDTMVAQNFSDGDGCSTDGTFGTKFNNPVRNGDTVNSAFFIVIKKYYSSDPAGDTQYGHDAYLQPRGRLASEPGTANDYKNQYRTDDERIARLVPDGALPSPASSPMEPTADNWAGTWRGQVIGDSTTYDLQVNLDPVGDNLQGRVEYPQLNCGGTWTETKRHATSRNFTEVIQIGADNCTPTGELVLTLEGDALLFRYLSSRGRDISARLTRIG